MPSIPFTMQEQQALNLCWAAVAASVSQWRDAPVSQCQVAQGVLILPPGTHCCTSLGPCNKDGPLGPALQFCQIPISVPLFRPLRMEEIQGQINAGKVICAGIAWTGGGSHYVAITGYEPDALNTLHIQDPYFGPSDVPYQVFVSSYRYLGRWEETINLT